MNEIYEKLDELLSGIAENDIDQESSTFIYEKSKELDSEGKQELCNRISKYLNGNIHNDIWINSFMLKIMPCKDRLVSMIRSVIDTDKLNWQQKYFLFGQFCNKIFMDSSLNTEDAGLMLWTLIQNIKDSCKKDITVPLQPIPVEERKEDMAVVIVEQFLSAEHGPTKTVLDRCRILQKAMKKRVLLINTAELVTNIGAVPFFDTVVGNYFPHLIEKNTVEWKGAEIPFFQCDYNMPSVEGMEELLYAIIRLKPSSVVLVGGISLFAGLVNDLVPVVTVGTIQSGLAITLAEHQIIDVGMMDKCTAFAKKLGKPEDYIIQGKFTFSLKEQEEHISRQMVGIPEDSFVMVSIGGRLDMEITDDFLSHLENVMDERTYFAIVGKCDNVEEMKLKHPKISNQIVYLGFCSDILSRIEICDLYVNPTRRGGGTSCVEAMFKGKPVVTVNYGDVAGIVGEQFSCNDYDEMERLILRYKNDKEFYATQSAIATEVANDYLDSEKEFSRIMLEYNKRIS